MKLVKDASLVLAKKKKPNKWSCSSSSSCWFNWGLMSLWDKNFSMDLDSRSETSKQTHAWFSFLFFLSALSLGDDVLKPLEQHILAAAIFWTRSLTGRVAGCWWHGHICVHGEGSLSANTALPDHTVDVRKLLQTHRQTDRLSLRLVHLHFVLKPVNLPSPWMDCCWSCRWRSLVWGSPKNSCAGTRKLSVSERLVSETGAEPGQRGTGTKVAHRPGERSKDAQEQHDEQSFLFGTFLLDESPSLRPVPAGRWWRSVERNFSSSAQRCCCRTRWDRRAPLLPIGWTQLLPRLDWFSLQLNKTHTDPMMCFWS